MFFVDDVDNPEWKIVVQAEPRSRRVEEGVMEPLLEARGAAREVGVDLGLQPSELNADRMEDTVRVPTEEVDTVDAQFEDEDSEAGFEDVDVEDNVDDPVYDDADYSSGGDGARFL